MIKTVSRSPWLAGGLSGCDPHAYHPAPGRGLEALAVNDRRGFLVVLGLRDPHLLEGGKRGQDRAADPGRVPALGRGDDPGLCAVVNRSPT